ncbi:MAG TPA: tRNA (adenosine(37)-N6)-dimethylallyltransferase MiaA [Phycisphaerae bacterium]|nr:tRNA (adenosine(37)-N6)-dimethylallyltransferase MiaA [Phycisphaerae bacterium]
MTAATPILILTGQTATGKERLALAVAERVGGEIVSADSMKVYRGMDIGTAKPSSAERRAVAHHLVDVADLGPGAPGFSTARWVELADAAIADIAARGRVPIVSGGTALYLKALLEGLFEGPAADAAVRAHLTAEAEAQGAPALHARLARLDPEAAARIHPNDLRRIIRALEVRELTGSPISALQTQWGSRRERYRPLLVAVRRSPQDLDRRIEARVRRMVEAGFLEEVRRLAARPGGLALSARQALGYAEMLDHLAGRLTWEEAVEATILHTRQFARAQMKWLKRFEGLVWLDAGPGTPAEELVGRVVDLWRTHVSAPSAG